MNEIRIWRMPPSGRRPQSQVAVDSRTLHQQIGNRAFSQLVPHLPVQRGVLQDLTPSWVYYLADRLHESFLEKVSAIDRGNGPTKAELAELTQIRYRLSLVPGGDARLLQLEKELLLWPRRVVRMDLIIEMVTGRDDTSASSQQRRNAVESSLGRFDGPQGQEIADRLADDASKWGDGNNCLDFLYQNGLARLFADEGTEVGAAKKAYAAGAKERLKSTSRGARTLSRLASELRLQGLVSSVHLLGWVEKKYEPRPVELINSLSSAGEGWYFFMVSAGSYHTFAVGVHVTTEGRTYYKIQDGGSTRKSAAALNDYVDYYGHIHGAASRIWQVFVRPQA